jgi:peptidoglycan/xylan/chitin deacetylase (PgdA/CDA1 family)
VTLPSPWGSLRSVWTRSPVVALTFDDGPDPHGTPAVLDALAAAGARATFFVLADRVEQHPALAQRVRADGHEVGLHGPDHRRLTAVPRAELTELLGAAKRRVEDVIGCAVNDFRPPFGALTPTTLSVARSCGLDVVMWSVDPDDWRDDASAVASRTLVACRPGAIVLLHDTRADDDPGDRRAGRDCGRTAQAVLDGLAARHLDSITVSDLRARGVPVRSLWFKS